MVMDERPDLFEKLQALKKDKRSFYRFLGEAERGAVERINTPLRKRGSHSSKIINPKKIKQVTFKKWQEMEEERLKAFFKGDYVFLYNGDFYTLWGSRLSKDYVGQAMLYMKSEKASLVEMDSYLYALFNHRDYVKSSRGSFHKLPYSDKVSSRYTQKIINDFHKQVGLESIDPDFEFLNKKHFVPIQTDEGFTEYFSSKRHAYFNKEVLEDHQNACEIRPYVQLISHKKTARKYVDTLVFHKAKLMKELSLTNNEYNELMALAVGILQVESKMGRSPKYIFKENLRFGELNIGQRVVRGIKNLVGRSDGNSRGLTQIKDIHILLENSSYSYLKDDDLDDPESAAIATMFVLKEKYGYLKHFQNRRPHIDKHNWPDYLYYFYQGSSAQITRGKATPVKNLRIQKILKLRDKMMIFEKCH